MCRAGARAAADPPPHRLIDTRTKYHHLPLRPLGLTLTQPTPTNPNQVHEALLLLLDHQDGALLEAACGVLINLAGDPPHAAALLACGGGEALLG